MAELPLTVAFSTFSVAVFEPDKCLTYIDNYFATRGSARLVM